MVSYWVWPVSEENWDIVKREQIWATYSKIATEKVKEGDDIVFYVVGRGIFGGIFKVTSEWHRTNELRWADERREEKKLYPYEVRLQMVKLGEVDVRLLKDRLSFLNVNYFWLRLMGTQGGPANHGRPISAEDYELIANEMTAKRPQLPPEERREVKRPTHDELKSMLKEIGDMLGFVSKTEEWSPDGTYRYDVTWRDYEEHRPMKVFEVELSKNVDHALSSLSHAYDMWGPEQLYLVLEDEGDILRAEKLVTPRIRGAFVRIKERLRLLPWTAVSMLYDMMKQHRELITDLARR
ncbi:MAG: EVE domain-containing protein [Nitrososphaerota archaeon]